MADLNVDSATAATGGTNAVETKKEDADHSNVKGESVAEVQTKTQTHALDSITRVVPIHDSLKEIKMPASMSDRVQVGSPAVNLHPVTLQPFSIDELRGHNMDALLRQFSNPDAAKQEIEVTVRELRKIIDDNEKKTKEIEREMEEKEKTREIERKVFARKSGKDL